MATTRGQGTLAREAQGGRVVHVTPATMDAMYADVRLTHDPWLQDLAVAKDVARQAKVSVGAVLARMGYPADVVRRYSDDFPGRIEPEEAERWSTPTPEEEREAYERRNADIAAAEEAGYTAWLARQGLTPETEDEPERQSIRERIANLPVAKVLRRSQRAEGRHSRYVRARAKEWGVTPEQADQRIANHPPACEYRQ